MPTPFPSRTDLTAAALVDRAGEVFQVFDRTQDSGHVSFGVRAVDGIRYFIKTAGSVDRRVGSRSHTERVDALRRAARLERSLRHRALNPWRQLTETADGIAVVHDWFTGELLHAIRAERDDPDTAFRRFMALPPNEIAAALDDVIDLHVVIDESGWMIGDFYDGCLMYDFGTSQMRVMDFESYRPGSYRNDRGRLPGSTRFMAPEEFQVGAMIDSRTAVFGLGRMIDIFFLARNLWPQVRSVVARATAPEPDRRWSNPRELRGAWRGALAASGAP